MPAITSLDLSNAKLDVDHIAAIATSTIPTATDRLGNTKDTMSGAIYSIKAFNNRGAWQASTSYAVKDLVSVSGTWYVAVVPHISSATFADDTASYWRIYQGVTSGDLSTSSGASLVGYAPSISGTDMSNVLEKLRLTPINIEEFTGVVADGITNDGPAIRAAILVCKAAGKLLVFSGKYAVDRITVQDAVYNFAMHSNNAQFTGISNSSQPGIFEIVNCVDFHMTGNWRIDGADNPNYEMGMCIRVQAGTSQSTTRVNIYNPTIRNCQIGIGVGRYNIEYQCSEISIFGANFFKCPMGVYNAGANTGAQYIDCNIVSEANAAFPTTVERAIWQEGGFIKVVGGSVFSNPSATHAILQNPCMSSTYGNAYGTMNIAAAHVEVNSQLMFVTNSRALGAPVSDTSSFAINNCTGFCGAPAAADFVFFGDPTYAGTLNITGNNWYSTAVRTGYNISSASPSLNIVTDKKSMGKNFKNWLGGIYGGKVLHDEQAVMSAFSLNATFSAGTSNVLKFVTNDTNAELARYGVDYDNTTGIYTARHDFEWLRFTLNLAGGSVLVGPDLYLTRNGNAVRFGVWSYKSGLLHTTIRDVGAGNTFSIVLINYGASITFNPGVENALNIMGATRA